MIEKGKPTSRDYDKLHEFLGLTESHSCRTMLDDLTQKLFGSSVMTPTEFWNGGSKQPVVARMHPDSYVASQVRQFMGSGTGAQGLEAYIGKLTAIHAEILTIGVYLATTITVVYDFLEKNGQLPQDLKEQINPALLQRPGLCGMIHEFVIPYLMAPCPEAFMLYYTVFGERKPLRLALFTRSKGRILEGNTSPERKPLVGGQARWAAAIMRSISPSMPSMTRAC